VAPVVLYVAIHCMFVSQSSQVPALLMAFAMLFASSSFSVITPQGGSQNAIFVGGEIGRFEYCGTCVTVPGRQ